MKNKAQVWIGVVLTLLILGACQSASLENLKSATYRV